MKKQVLLLSVTAFALASCSSLEAYRNAGPMSVSAPDAPAGWSSFQTDQSPFTSDWIATFADPDLVDLVDEAMTGSFSIDAAEARIRAAEASARAANAGRLPFVSADLSASRRETDVAASDSFGGGLGVSWEADLWGRLGNQARAGALRYEATQADYEAVRLSTAAQVARAWFNLLEARLQTDLAQRDVETKERSLGLIERRFEAGVSRSSDVRTFRSALASSQASLASRERVEASAARSLEILLGRYPAANVGHDRDLPSLSALEGVGGPADILQRRPDLIAAEARLEAAGLDAAAARAALLPSLSLSGSLDTGGPEFGDIFDLDTYVASVLGSLSAPIFQGGRLRAERDRTAANAEAELANYANTVLAAWREAEDAIYADGLLAQRLDALRTAFEQAAEAEDLVIRQYGSGLATVFELLDAQARRIAAEGQFISARRERATNRVDIYLAIGGNFIADDLRNVEG